MKKQTIALLGAALLLVSSAEAQYKVLLPQCCSVPSSVFVLNAETGSLERALAAATSTSFNVFALTAVPLRDGALAVLNDFPGTSSSTGTVSIVNPGTGALLGSVALPGEPWTMALNPKSGVIYARFTLGALYQIEELNPSTLQVIQQFTVTGGSSITVSPDGQRIYIPVFGTGVVVYSTSSLAQIGTVPGPDQVIGLSPDSKTLYAASDALVAPSNSVYFVDTASLEITTIISLGNLGTLGGDSGGPGSGAVSADGTRLYINFGTSILTLDVTTRAKVDVPCPADDQGEQVLAASNGSVYVRVQNGAANLAVVFDPAGARFPRNFPCWGSAGWWPAQAVRSYSC